MFTAGGVGRVAPALPQAATRYLRACAVGRLCKLRAALGLMQQLRSRV